MVAKCTQRGMTLMELLVIMAIITIVVAMIIANRPGGCGFGGKPVYATREISTIELAVTKMLSDVGETSAHSFFDEAAFNATRDDLQRAKKLSAFEASVEIYSTALTGLMRHGKNTPAQQCVFAETLNTNVVGRLGLSYDESIGLDPWGEPYRFFPGPWPESMGPVLLRTFLVHPQEAWYPGDSAQPEPDALTLEPTPFLETNFGFPAPSRRDLYIWSTGANIISGQPAYDPSHQYTAPASQHYDQQQEPEYWGGGDDINNCDKVQSFMWHYN